MKTNRQAMRKSFYGLEKMGDIFSQSYTFTVEPKCNGLVSADTWNLKSGTTYELTLRASLWRWLYENELGDAVLQHTEKVVEMLSME